MTLGKEWHLRGFFSDNVDFIGLWPINDPCLVFRIDILPVSQLTIKDGWGREYQYDTGDGPGIQWVAKNF